jgi:hypothetical protein
MDTHNRGDGHGIRADKPRNHRAKAVTAVPLPLPQLVAKKRGGKQRGWTYMNSVRDAKAALQRMINLMTAGNPAVLVPRRS